MLKQSARCDIQDLSGPRSLNLEKRGSIGCPNVDNRVIDHKVLESKVPIVALIDNQVTE